jgi:hypothetical protein
MLKRELSEDEEDPLVKVIAIKEAKLCAEYAEREKQEKEFIEPLVEQMRKDMFVPQETIEKLIDQYEQTLIECNDSTKDIKLTVNLLMKNNEGPKEVLYQLELAFDKVVKEVAYMNYSSQNVYRARGEVIIEFRQRVVDAWNKRHPKLQFDHTNVWSQRKYRLRDEDFSLPRFARNEINSLKILKLPLVCEFQGSFLHLLNNLPSWKGLLIVPTTPT